MHIHSPSWFLLSTSATAHISLNAFVPAMLFTVFALVTVCARWYSRIVCRPGHVGPVNWCVSGAMLMSICITGLIGGEFLLDSMHNDKEDRKKANLSILLKLLFTQSLLYHLSTALIKSSFILQYLRLFTFAPRLSSILYLLLILVISAAAWGCFGVIFLCNPIHSYWDINTPGATCESAEEHFVSTGVLGIVLDWAVWMLPIPVVGRLRLPRRQKRGMLGGFWVGWGGVYRAGTFALTWSTIEINVAIICASLLVMKPLFAHFVPAIVSEQPASARGDARLGGGLHWLEHWLNVDMTVKEADEDEDKIEMERYGRRDTATALSGLNMAEQAMILGDGMGLTKTKRERRGTIVRRNSM